MLEINTDGFFEEAMEKIGTPDFSTEKEKINEQPIDIAYDEEVLDDTLAKDFSSQIIDRGENYYMDNRVLNVYKNKNKYYATVKGGSHQDVYYNVEITVTDEDTADYECTCPCEFPCKHEYAVILAIANRDYTEKKLKPIIKEKEIDFKELIKMIPAEDLKKFILALNGTNTVVLNYKALSAYFKKYLPKQKYDYYYNNLYNALALEEITLNELLDDYIETAKKYVNNNEFEESFKIVKSIIEAYNDTEKINFASEVFDVISRLGIILRISYRKANDVTKRNILQWSEKLEKENYYNNYYLEDLILSLGNVKI